MDSASPLCKHNLKSPRFPAPSRGLAAAAMIPHLMQWMPDKRVFAPQLASGA